MSLPTYLPTYLPYPTFSSPKSHHQSTKAHHPAPSKPMFCAYPDRVCSCICSCVACGVPFRLIHPLPRVFYRTVAHLPMSIITPPHESTGCMYRIRAAGHAIHPSRQSRYLDTLPCLTQSRYLSLLGSVDTFR